MNDFQAITVGWKAGAWCLELNNFTDSALISSKRDLEEKYYNTDSIATNY